ncbi:GDSL esterase/lipase EXL3-like isoform X2 [Oryza glaberrima]|uniref:GDSL esterase/lipase EXL3-like isoform X2 n=1 Tax=Oryza glaberrima TaxID=4538 RepID=UPI00224C5B0A|nr:GDSL esterase/lipase EXL3-like isoform X2 [Oryza glaberrima]
MEHGSVKLLLLVVFCVSPWQVAATTTANGTGGGGRPRVPAVLVFGDSIVDTGNNNAVLTLTRSNFRPYGKDLNGGEPTGRFSNGRIPPDFLDLVPAYLGTDLTDGDLLTGVSFASAGSGYDPLTSTLVAVLPMQEQLNMFAEYKEKLAGIAGEAAAARIVSESLFLVCAGSDDIANNYYLAPVRPLQFDISSYVDFLANLASDFIKQLHRQGARRIAVLGMPPIGCVPSQRRSVAVDAAGGGRECDAAQNRAARLFNAKLEQEIGCLRETLQLQSIGYVDIYGVLDDMIADPGKYGFDVSTRGCCGTGEFEVTLLCNQLTATTCADDRKFVFWDSFHPTERAYSIMVDYLYQRYVDKLL